MTPAHIFQQALPSAEEARERAREIFESSRYKQVVDESAIDSTVTSVIGLWGRLQSWIADLAAESPTLHLLLLIGLLLLLAALIGHMVWSWLRFRRMRVDPFGQDRLPAGADLELEFRSALAAAEQAGRWTDALGLRFRWLVWRLQHANSGRVLPGWTNRELLSRWPDDSASRAHMQAVVSLLDRTWYAEAECTEAEYRTASKQLDEVGR